MMRLVRNFLMIFFLLLWTSLWPVVPPLDVIDTPTAITMPRANYNTGFWAYDNGGILTKAQIALHDNIYLGAAFDIENAIGSDEPRMNIPGVVGKIKFTDGWPEFPILVAIGYDSFYAGKSGKTTSENPFNRMIFGPYAVITKPIYLLGGEQHVHFGIRTPIQPNYIPEDTSVYISMDFPIGQFVPMIEIERVYFDSTRFNQTLFNYGFRFNFFESLALEVNIMTGQGMLPNRMVVFEYFDRF